MGRAATSDRCGCFIHKMDNNYTVYKHTSPNGKVYIGITSQKPEMRWQGGSGYSRNSHFYNAIKKYGWNNFKHEILENNLSADDARKKEKELISAYKSNLPEHGYNNSEGGDGAVGFHLSEKAKKKLSDGRKGEKNWNYGKHLTDERKKAISDRMKGENHPNYGKRGVLSPNYGRKLSEETKRKISNAQKGKIISEESIKKMSESKKGKSMHENTRKALISANIGRHQTNETKIKIGESNSKKVFCVETKNVYSSIKNAHELTGICYNSISLCCLSKRKTAGGYHWEYYEEGD